MGFSVAVLWQIVILWQGGGSEIFQGTSKFFSTSSWYSGSLRLWILLSSEYRHQPDNLHFLPGYVPVTGVTWRVVTQPALQGSLAPGAGTWGAGAWCVPGCQQIQNFKSLLYSVTCSSIWCINTQNVLLGFLGSWACALLPTILHP